MERNIFDIVFAGFNIVFTNNNKSKGICVKINLTVKALCLGSRNLQYFIEKRNTYE